MRTIDISKLNKAEVLAALYNNSAPQGLGMLQFIPDDMTVEEAQKMLDDGQTYFDYIKGRVLKVDLSGDTLKTWLYDRDNGDGAAYDAVAFIKYPDRLTEAKKRYEQRLASK